MKSNNIIITIIIILFSSCNDNAESYINKAEEMEYRGDYNAAIQIWNKLLNKDSTLLFAYINRGVDKSILEDFKGAIDDYTKVIIQDSTHVMAWVNRGNNKKRIKDYWGAINDYQKAIGLKTIIINGQVSIIDNCIDSKDVDYAYIIFERAIAYYLLSHYKQAICDFDYCIEKKYKLDECVGYKNEIYKDYYKNDTIKKYYRLNP